MKRSLLAATSAVAILVAPCATPASAAQTVHMTAVSGYNVQKSEVHMTRTRT